MKRVFSTGLVFMVLFALAGQAWAGKKQATTKGNDKPEPYQTEVTVVTATVEEVDHGKRILSLREADGKILAVRVDKALNQLDQVRKGDSFRVAYLEALGVYIRKPDWPPAVIEAGNIAVTPKGRPPAVVVVDAIQLPGTVEAIDQEKHTVTLKNSEGKAKTFTVDEKVKRFEKLKKGEEIVLVITEAVAISLEKP